MVKDEDAKAAENTVAASESTAGDTADSAEDSDGENDSNSDDDGDGDGDSSESFFDDSES